MPPDLTDLARIAARSVVGIEPAGRHGGRHATATVLDRTSVVTTAHNISGRDGSVATRRPSVTIRFPDGRRGDGTVTAVNEDYDLAVVTVDIGDAEPVDWGDAGDLQTGSSVTAAAAPGGRLRITPGVVAAVDSRLWTRSGSPVDRVFEHTAPLVRGASGGSVLDGDGRLVGLNINRLDGGLYQAVGAGDRLRSVIDRLASGEQPATPRLGVTITPQRQARWLRQAVGLPPADGALVAGVEEESPAAAAGLTRGDLIISVDDQTVASADDLVLALRRAGDEVTLGILHAGTERQELTAVPTLG